MQLENMCACKAASAGSASAGSGAARSVHVQAAWALDSRSLAAWATCASLPRRLAEWVGDIGLEERGGCVLGMGENRLPSATGRNAVQVQDNRGVSTLLRIVRVHVQPLSSPGARHARWSAVGSSSEESVLASVCAVARLKTGLVSAPSRPPAIRDTRCSNAVRAPRSSWESPSSCGATLCPSFPLASLRRPIASRMSHSPSSIKAGNA